MSEPRSRPTARLVLRGWRDADREPWARLCADPEVMEYFPAPLGREEADAAFDRLSEHVLRHDWGLWAVEHEGEFIGFTGLAPVGFPARFAPAVEIGWRLVRAAWGQGFATEAAHAAIDVAATELALDEVVSFTAVGNGRSRAVMSRLGMSHDADDDFDHPGLPPGHPLARHVLYRLPLSARVVP